MIGLYNVTYEQIIKTLESKEFCFFPFNKYSQNYRPSTFQGSEIEEKTSLTVAIRWEN